MNKNQKKSNLKSRKTVATGAEATKLMFERQLAQMYKQQQHLQGKSNMKTTENLWESGDMTKGASLKIMQDSSGKYINI